MKRQLLFGFWIALLITLACYPVRATTFDANYTPDTETSPSVNTASAVVNWSLQPYCSMSGDNCAGGRITDLTDHLLKSLVSWPYWAKAHFLPNFVISLDTALENYAVGDYNNCRGQGNDGVLFLGSDSHSYTIQPHWSSPPVIIVMTWANFQPPFGQGGQSYDYCGAAMKKISLWDEGISSNQGITVRADDFPLNHVSLNLDSSQSLAFPGTPVLLISGLVGLAFYRKRQPKPKAKSCSPVP